MTRELVIFRKERDGQIVALFPEIPGDRWGTFCTCYTSRESHSDANYYGVIGVTKPATKREYRDLLKELRRRGYKGLRVIQRASYAMHEKRRKTAEALRNGDGNGQTEAK